jgi:hypothetical protein
MAAENSEEKKRMVLRCQRRSLGEYEACGNPDI